MSIIISILFGISVGLASHVCSLSGFCSWLYLPILIVSLLGRYANLRYGIISALTMGAILDVGALYLGTYALLYVIAFLCNRYLSTKLRNIPKQLQILSYAACSAVVGIFLHVSYTAILYGKIVYDVPIIVSSMLLAAGASIVVIFLFDVLLPKSFFSVRQNEIKKSI